MKTNWLKRFLLATSSAFAVASFSSFANAQLVPVPGTSISLEPPVGFSLSEQFSGFVNLDNFSSIVITELPLEGYSEIATIFSSTQTAIEAFASQGILVKEVSTVIVGNMQVPFVTGVQNVNDVSVDKYIALLRGDKTILLTFNVTDDRLGEEAVIKAIESIEISATPSVEEQISQLPFTFKVAPPFQVLQTISGSGVALTPNGESDSSGKKPVIVIASSIGSVVNTTDLATFAERLLLNTEGFTNAIISDRKPINFAGGNGYLIEAIVTDGVVLQYLKISANTSSYVRLIVAGEAEEVEKLMPSIQAITNSVRVKDTD